MSASALWNWSKFHGLVALETPLRVGKRLRRGRPDLMLFFGRSPGDDLLCTALTRALAERGQRKIWMMSNHPDLFDGNPDVEHVVPVSGTWERFAHRSKINYRYLEYAAVDVANDRSTSPTRHIIAELCARMGVKGQVELLPRYFPTPEELKAAEWARNKLVIQSSGLAARFPMQNKQWEVQRFQEIVTKTHGECEFVQVGAASDREIVGAEDLRGKTTKRETAALLAQCRLFVGNVGFLMHLARAVNCPSVIVYGGREAPWQSGYTCNANIYSPEPCAPCWRFNGCDYDRVCLSKISSDDALLHLRAMLAKPRAPLAVDVVEVAPSGNGTGPRAHSS